MIKNILLLISFIPLPTVAHATLEEIMEPQIKILGKGIVDRKTHETIAYACVGKIEGQSEADCTQLRIVYYNPQDEKSYYLSEVIQLQAGDQKSLHQYFKRTKKNYFQKNPTRLSKNFIKLGKWLKRDQHAVLV